MTQMNTCDKCGHYSWVHDKHGVCGLDYCNCGKDKGKESKQNQVAKRVSRDTNMSKAKA